jgi:hypothetical protein
VEDIPTLNETVSGESNINDVAKDDAGKYKIINVSKRFIDAVFSIRTYGQNKYGDSENWKNVSIDRYINAAGRHLIEYLMDNKSVDMESIKPHLHHFACNIVFIYNMTDSNFELYNESKSIKYNISLDGNILYVAGPYSWIKHVASHSNGIVCPSDLSDKDRIKINNGITNLFFKIVESYQQNEILEEANAYAGEILTLLNYII